MRTQLILILLLGVYSGFCQNTFKADFSNPPKDISIVAEDFISTRMNERDFAVSPDGKEIYFTVTTPRSSLQTIVSCTKQKDGTWSSPEVVSFSGTYSDLEPAFSSDGKTLYFASNRPVAGVEKKDFDIWKVSRQRDGWATPENLGAPVNTDGDEFYPSIARNGNLYFTATYDNGIGKEDIFVSTWNGKSYSSPVPLDTTVNSATYEFNAFVSPDEDYIIFTSYGRKDDMGRGDLYISVKQNGKWQPSVHLKELNSSALDYCPYVSPDGKTLFFTSERHSLPSQLEKKGTYATFKQINDSPLNGSGNIYRIDFIEVLKRHQIRK